MNFWVYVLGKPSSNWRGYLELHVAATSCSSPKVGKNKRHVWSLVHEYSEDRNATAAFGVARENLRARAREPLTPQS